MKDFRIYTNKGFQLTFENGLTISVMFGTGNYCENRGASIEDFGKAIDSSNDAEIAIWDKKDNWFDFGGNTVKGWVSSNEVAKWINKVSTAASLTEINI